MTDISAKINQISFTLPLPNSRDATMAAQAVVKQLGFLRADFQLVTSVDKDCTLFVVRGEKIVTVPSSEISKNYSGLPRPSYIEINQRAKKVCERRLFIVGGCVGGDSDSVGIDSIFNVKGYLGDPGLEAYSSFDAMNVRGQPDLQKFAEMLCTRRADCVMIAPVITETATAPQVLKQFLDVLLQTNNPVAKKMIKICFASRITHADAVLLGYDTGFGAGTLPGEVAEFIVTRIQETEGRK